MQNNYKQLLKKLIRHSVFGMIVQCAVFASVFASGAKNIDRSVTTLQEVTVTGRVTSSEDGATLPGVNVPVKGTSRGTTTDADGKYTIQVSSADAVLVFSFIGY